ncbi:ABC transporter substrate-binding protein [Roseomonas sp. BN140053]|uniref:ABC transporter substrate-binding protein n=1 Tax=Roseomonas sp. BN140053 TaxID=3391898 RepID=UPI0039E75B80
MPTPSLSRRTALTLALSAPWVSRLAHGQGSAGADFELSIAAGADPVSLDPRKTWVAQGYSMNAHVFEPLVFRKEQDGNVQLVPVLAESWTQTGPTTLEIKIRQGVKFQNGEPLDAAAVAYTLTSIMDPAFVTNLKTWTSDIESVAVKDPSTLVITTKYRTRGLLNSLAQVPIVAPRAAQEQGAAFERRPVGTGPYRYTNYVPSSLVVVERYDGYWGSPGKAKKLTFRIMPENSVRLAALQAGEVQLAENLPPDKMDAIRSTSGLAVVYTATLRVDYLVLNFRNPIMANRAFREALSLAIDRNSLVKNLLGGTTRVANSISPPGTTGYDASLPDYEFNLARAKELLKEAGYTGQPITMGAPVGRYSMDKQVNEAIAGMFRNAGLNIRFEALAWASYSPKYTAGGYDIAFVGQTDFTVNPHKHWASLFYSPSAINKYSNPEMDRIIEAVREELDDAKAVELYKQGQALERRNWGGALPLYYEPQLIAVSSKVRDFQPRLDEYIIVKDVTLAR